MFNTTTLFYMLSLMLTLNTCTSLSIHNQLETGDLIFVETNEKNLSGAISRVTKHQDSPLSYDHIGIIEKQDDQLYVLHSSTLKGSNKEPLDSFVNAYKDLRLVIYRLKGDYQRAIPKAIDRANDMLGKPYNTLYILNDTSYYCSDYIQRAFEEDSIFKLNPMTFINPNTQETDAYWASFYSLHKQEVPEGKPGCNPNGMAKSTKMEKMYMFFNQKLEKIEH